MTNTNNNRIKNDIIAEMMIRKNRNDNTIKIYNYATVIAIAVVFFLLVTMFFVQSAKIDSLLAN